VEATTGSGQASEAVRYRDAATDHLDDLIVLRSEVELGKKKVVPGKIRGFSGMKDLGAAEDPLEGRFQVRSDTGSGRQLFRHPMG
jgi:hypothetical protein